MYDSHSPKRHEIQVFFIGGLSSYELQKAHGNLCPESTVGWPKLATTEILSEGLTEH